MIVAPRFLVRVRIGGAIVGRIRALLALLLHTELLQLLAESLLLVMHSVKH